MAGSQLTAEDERRLNERAMAAAEAAIASHRSAQLHHLGHRVLFAGPGQSLRSLVSVSLSVSITSGPFSASLSDSRGKEVIRRDGFAPGRTFPPGAQLYFSELLDVACGVSLDSTWTLTGCTFVEDLRILVAVSA